jgi:hypothetical protein
MPAASARYPRSLCLACGARFAYGAPQCLTPTRYSRSMASLWTVTAQMIMASITSMITDQTG